MAISLQGSYIMLLKVSGSLRGFLYIGKWELTECTSNYSDEASAQVSFFLNSLFRYLI